MKLSRLLCLGLCLLTLTGTACAKKPTAPDTKKNGPVTAYMPRKLEGPVHLVWDWQAPGEAASKLAQEKKLPGINVLSPSWFILSDTEGNIEVKNATTDYAPQAHAKGYRVWALITNGFDPDRTHGLLDNPAGRQKAAENLLQLARTYQLDGINLDFENIKLEDSDRLTAFVGELSGVLKPAGYTVSIDVTVPSDNGNWSKCYNRKELAEQVDYVMLMAYDEHHRLSNVAGSVASLPWVEQGIQKTLLEVPKEKLVLGMPLYMRDWTVKEDGTVSARTLSMPGARKRIRDHSLVPAWLSSEGQYYFEYKEQGTLHKVWMEEGRSLALKNALISRYDLAGSAYWRKGLEEPEVWENAEAYTAGAGHADAPPENGPADAHRPSNP